MKFSDTKKPRKYKLPQFYPKLTQKERAEVREQYIREQEWKCAHCGEDLTGFPAQSIRDKSLDMTRFPSAFLKYPVHLHHSHDTGLTIGAVHAYCNGVLWQYHGE